MNTWKMIFSGYLKSFRKNAVSVNPDEPIDFVVTWVDGSDPAWQEERAEFLGDDMLKSSGNGVCRYRDWASFRYWFLSLIHI